MAIRYKMEYISSRESITHKVLNEDTGELESKEFKEEKKKKYIKGGFNMIYHKNYEEVMEIVVHSQKEMKLFNWITNQFTYKQVETAISYSDIENLISRSQFNKMVKKLVEIGYLMRVKRGVYRLNPFIFLPYRADAEELQREWKEKLDISKSKIKPM